MATGRIIEWNEELGAGYIESEQRRVFLHRRDFAVPGEATAVGDLMSFLPGTDPDGRISALQAVHIAERADRRRGLYWFALLLLCLPPFVALYRLAGTKSFRYLVGYWLVISLITYLAYSWDKRHARKYDWRTTESTLHFFEIVGGWPGAFVAQRQLHHKSSQFIYQIYFWLIVLVYQFATIDYLRGWPLMQGLIEKMGQ